MSQVKLPNKLVFNPKIPKVNKDDLNFYNSITPQSANDYGKDKVLYIPKKE